MLFVSCSGSWELESVLNVGVCWLWVLGWEVVMWFIFFASGNEDMFVNISLLSIWDQVVCLWDSIFCLL